MVQFEVCITVKQCGYVPETYTLATLPLADNDGQKVLDLIMDAVEAVVQEAGIYSETVSHED